MSDLMDRAKKLYETRLKAELERAHMHSFVAIEPDSGDYCLGDTLSEAAGKADAAYPDRKTAILRVGHQAAIDLSNHLELVRKPRR